MHTQEIPVPYITLSGEGVQNSQGSVGKVGTERNLLSAQNLSITVLG